MSKEEALAEIELIIDEYMQGREYSGFDVHIVVNTDEEEIVLEMNV